MNSVMAIDRQSKGMAGFAALIATLFITGGTLALADHYAGTAGEGSVYMAHNPAAQHAAPPLSRNADNGRVAAYS